ncbi:uncharacterized protein [Amphiura filiformis]|uniref:uncharacterized protein n=1 Tax=Amphiura filiformis TaxID=82378 RepID=UPI003B217458
MCKLTYSPNLIIRSGDIEPNPGPRTPKCPCGECKKACTSYKGANASILCDSCNLWFHSDCVGLSDPVFEVLAGNDSPWECYKCGCANISPGIFDSFTVGESDSSDSFARSSCSSTSSCQPGSPMAKSSPSKPTNSPTANVNNLRTLEVNFQSVFAKRVEFWSLIEATKPDIIFGCETWLKPSISYGEVFPPGYNLYRKDRSNGHGGVLLAVHSSLNSHQIDIRTDAEFVAAKIINRNQPIVIGALYRTPDSNQDKMMNELNRTILDLCQSNSGAAIWISGDINLPDIDWATNHIISHQYPVALNESFLQTMESAGLEQLVDFPTRGDNTLDIVLTNRPSLVNRCEGAPGLIDHDIVFTDMNVRAYRRKPVRRKIFLWKRADWDVIRHRVKSWSDNFTAINSTSTPVEQLAEDLQSELTKLLAECVPTKI